MGAEVTKGQQWRILLSTSLVAFTVIGKHRSISITSLRTGTDQARVYTIVWRIPGAL